MKKTFDELVFEEMQEVRQFLPDEGSEELCKGFAVKMMELVRKETLKDCADLMQKHYENVNILKILALPQDSIEIDD